MTHGDIAAHMTDVYGTEMSKMTLSTITDKVLAGMTESVVESLWQCCRACPDYGNSTGWCQRKFTGIVSSYLGHFEFS